MVVHIVMIKLKESEKSSKNLNMLEERIKSLSSKISILESLETGLNFSNEDRAMDFVLVAKFKDRDGLREYANHPEHLKVIQDIKDVVLYTKVVDYEEM